jgi:hypothetical protein
VSAHFLQKNVVTHLQCECLVPAIRRKTKKKLSRPDSSGLLFSGKSTSNSGLQDAIDALNSLQTPYAIIAARQKAGIRPDATSIGEMKGYLNRIGYSVHIFIHLATSYLALFTLFSSFLTHSLFSSSSSFPHLLPSSSSLPFSLNSRSLFHSPLYSSQLGFRPALLSP